MLTLSPHAAHITHCHNRYQSQYSPSPILVGTPGNQSTYNGPLEVKFERRDNYYWLKSSLGNVTYPGYCNPLAARLNAIIKEYTLNMVEPYVITANTPSLPS
jgi:hypothetical protein